ncbi:hypothetical protein [Rhabdaerophilum sp. SD176]|uniref:hypothetical protein n=1 Tax=Rhabdaerophilum sp. SD176 TaxID=2983548 RepID=UPI0024DF8E67|nr:hypothetical protein [Rhabdaerophilum sp. SD176]
MIGLATQQGGQPLEVAARTIHEDWQAEWCPDLTAQANRAALASNPRLERRIGEDLAGRQGLPPLNTSSSPDLPCQIAYHVAIEAPARFRRVLGLAILAPVLAVEIEPEAVQRLREQFDEADLCLAFSVRAQTDRAAGVASDFGQIAAIADAEGAALIEEWLATLPPAFSGRIRLTMPKTDKMTEVSRLMDPLRLKLLRDVAKRLLAELPTGGSDARRA